MKDVKRYGHISYPVEATPAMVQLYPSMTIYTLAADYDAALSKLAAETLRADTAEAEVERLEDEFDTGEHSLITLKLKLAAAEQRVSELEKVLGRIARPHDCGCWPCMGSCVSQEALQITVDEMRDRAGAALNPTPKEESHE